MSSEILKNEYKHLIQKPELCFPTTLAMVALRKGVWLDEEEVAKDLDLKITKDVKPFFNVKLKIADGIEDAGYGIRRLDIPKVNKIFEDNNVPLKAKYYSISEIDDTHEFIVENMKKDRDIAILFSLKAMGFHERSWYHWVLIHSYNKEKKEIEVCDPQDTHKTYWEASLEDFLSAMSDKWDGKERGFMVFKERSK